MSKDSETSDQVKSYEPGCCCETERDGRAAGCTENVCGSFTPPVHSRTRWSQTQSWCRAGGLWEHDRPRQFPVLQEDLTSRSICRQDKPLVTVGGVSSCHLSLQSASHSTFL